WGGGGGEAGTTGGAQACRLTGGMAWVDLSDLPVVDGHCHPLLPDPWVVSPAALLDRFSEGRPGSMAAHVPHTGYYRRAVRALAALYQVEAAPEAILARRRTLGPEAARRLFVERRGSAAPGGPR